MLFLEDFISHYSYYLISQRNYSAEPGNYSVRPGSYSVPQDGDKDARSEIGIHGHEKDVPCDAYGKNNKGI